MYIEWEPVLTVTCIERPPLYKGQEKFIHKSKAAGNLWSKVTTFTRFHCFLTELSITNTVISYSEVLSNHVIISVLVGCSVEES